MLYYYNVHFFRGGTDGSYARHGTPYHGRADRTGLLQLHFQEGPYPVTHPLRTLQLRAKPVRLFLFLFHCFLHPIAACALFKVAHTGHERLKM